MPKSATRGTSTPAGTLHARQTRDLGTLETAPRRWHLRNWLQHRRRALPADVATACLGRLVGAVAVQSRLSMAHYAPDLTRLDREQHQRLQALLRANTPVHTLAAAFGGRVVDYGVVGTRVVTTAGVGFIVDAFQNTVELEIMKYHALGTGGTAEASGDGALVTEWTSGNYNTTRATGSLTEGGSANVYRTVGTNTKADAGSSSVTEHGIFSQAATGGGVLLDRTLFSVVTIAQNDALQTTYDLTLPAGS